MRIVKVGVMKKKMRRKRKKEVEFIPLIRVKKVLMRSMKIMMNMRVKTIHPKIPIAKVKIIYR